VPNKIGMPMVSPRYVIAYDETGPSRPSRRRFWIATSTREVDGQLKALREDPAIRVLYVEQVVVTHRIDMEA
jgi:hypothetical protein